MVATFPSALLLLCLPSLIISSPEPNAMQPKLRSPRHILSHFLEKIHQGLHTKEEKQEDQEEGVTEAPVMVDREVGFKVLEDCRTTVEEVEEVIYGEVKVRECRTSNITECHTEPVQKCEQRLVEQCASGEQEECREDPEERCVTRWRVEEHQEREKDQGVQVVRQVVARVPFLSCSLTSRRRCRTVPVTRCRWLKREPLDCDVFQGCARAGVSAGGAASVPPGKCCAHALGRSFFAQVPKRSCQESQQRRPHIVTRRKPVTTCSSNNSANAA